MSKATELSASERAALIAVGVEPDALPTHPPEAPVPRAPEELPLSWQSIINQAPPDVDRRFIHAFFETPQPDLERDDGSAMTPAEWLEAGLDPNAVAALARML